MWDKIIVPLDGSANAEAAIPYAQDFAAWTGSELILLFVREPNDTRSENILRSYMDTLVEKAKKETAQLLKKSDKKELKVRVELLTGDPAETILDFAEKNPVSKIMLSAHGQSGSKGRWPLGTVTDRIVNAATVPVSIIRTEGAKTALRPKVNLNNIMAPVDGSKESEVTLNYVKEMAAMVKADVTFVYALKVDVGFYGPSRLRDMEKMRVKTTKYLEKLVKRFEDEGIKAKYELLETIGLVSDALIKYAKEHPVDLIIMSTHGHSGFRRWVMGSVTSRVIREGNTPVMLIRPKGMRAKKKKAVS
jgi:nucleotide-binding universal stress UspA family protein